MPSMNTEKMWIDATFALNTAALHPNSSTQTWPLGRGAMHHSSDTKKRVRTQDDDHQQTNRVLRFAILKRIRDHEFLQRHAAACQL